MLDSLIAGLCLYHSGTGDSARSRPSDVWLIDVSEGAQLPKCTIACAPDSYRMAECADLPALLQPTLALYHGRQKQ